MKQMVRLTGLAVALGALTGACRAQNSQTQRLDFDPSVVHDAPILMSFDGPGVAASRLVSATLVILVNQSSLPDELEVFDASLPGWESVRTVASSGWQFYEVALDRGVFDEVSLGLEARLVVNYVHAYQGTQIDHAELTVVFEGCLADFDANGYVNGNDFDLYASAFEVGDVSADIDGNGYVNGNDYDLFASAFENGC